MREGWRDDGVELSEQSQERGRGDQTCTSPKRHMYDPFEVFWGGYLRYVALLSALNVDVCASVQQHLHYLVVTTV